MSGFGIDVGHLMQLACWPEKQLKEQFQDAEGKMTMSWVAGLVLLG